MLARLNCHDLQVTTVVGPSVVVTEDVPEAPVAGVVVAEIVVIGIVRGWHNSNGPDVYWYIGLSVCCNCLN